MPPRRDRSTGLEPEPRSQEGGADEAAAFIAETLLNLTAICHRHHLDTLGYLLDMAHMEAESIVRTRRKRGF